MSLQDRFEELHRRSAAALAGEDYELIFVDDGSTDGGFAVLERLHEADPRVRAVRFKRNAGQHPAMHAGLARARGDIVVTMDGDLQDDPAEIPRLLAKLQEGFDLVTGWKTHRRDPITRRIPSKIFNWAAGRLSGLHLHDMNCGLKAYRDEVG
jgi:glycosyltransferase involved in cell wall biosynthesis